MSEGVLALSTGRGKKKKKELVAQEKVKGQYFLDDAGHWK